MSQSSHTGETQAGENEAEALARQIFVITLLGVVAFGSAVIVYVLS